MIKILTILGALAIACYVWALVLEIRECIAKKSFD
jgi:hypothetical protein